MLLARLVPPRRPAPLRLPVLPKPPARPRPRASLRPSASKPLPAHVAREQRRDRGGGSERRRRTRTGHTNGALPTRTGSGTHPEPVLLLCGRRNRAGSPRKASWQPRPNGDPWPLLPDRRSRRVNSPPCCAMADAPVITGEVLEPASTRRFYRPLRLPRPNRGSAIAPSGSGGSHAYTACERQKRGRLHRKRSSLPLFSSCGAFDVLQQRLGA